MQTVTVADPETALAEDGWQPPSWAFTGILLVLGAAIAAFALFSPAQWEQRFRVESVSVNPDDNALTIRHNGCDETYRYEIEESPQQIVITLENKAQSIYNFCSRSFSHEVMLDEPIGERLIIAANSGRFLSPS